MIRPPPLEVVGPWVGLLEVGPTRRSTRGLIGGDAGVQVSHISPSGMLAKFLAVQLRAVAAAPSASPGSAEWGLSAESCLGVEDDSSWRSAVVRLFGASCVAHASVLFLDRR